MMKNLDDQIKEFLVDLEIKKEITVPKDFKISSNKIIRRNNNFKVVFGSNEQAIDMTIASTPSYVYEINLLDVLENENIEVVLKYRDKGKKLKNFKAINLKSIYKLLRNRVGLNNYTYSRYNNTIKSYVSELVKEKEYINSRKKYENIDSINSKILNWNNKLNYLNEIEDILSQRIAYTEIHEQDMKDLRQLSINLIKKNALSN